MTTTTCPTCGAELNLGDHPFCPHGATRARIATDDIPGGIWLENYGPTPVKVYSHSERRAIMRSQGLEEMVRHVGVPGTDKSPHTTDWSKGSIDAKTLANAAALVARAGGAVLPELEMEGTTFVDPVVRQIHATGDRGDVKAVLTAAKDSLLYQEDIDDADNMLNTIRQMEEKDKENASTNLDA